MSLRVFLRGEAQEVQLHPKQPQNYGLAKPDILNPQQARVNNHITHEAQPWETFGARGVPEGVFVREKDIVSRG